MKLFTRNNNLYDLRLELCDDIGVYLVLPGQWDYPKG